MIDKKRGPLLLHYYFIFFSLCSSCEGHAETVSLISPINTTAGFVIGCERALLEGVSSEANGQCIGFVEGALQSNRYFRSRPQCMSTSRVGQIIGEIIQIFRFEGEGALPVHAYRAVQVQGRNLCERGNV